jgi:subtilisin family serine protease
MFFHSIADHEMDQIMTPLVSAMSRYFRNSHLAGARKRTINRKVRKQALCLEVLESRYVPAGIYPNDPGFLQQWDLHNSGQSGGNYDADMDMPAAWSVSTGSMATVVAVLDSGVDYTDPDLYLNIWLNPGEIPGGIQANLTDADADGVITFRDLNAPANAGSVTDVNGNGYIDGGDLLHDSRWANGIDGDGNGKVDDLIGWDFHDNDNDPQATVESHGTQQAKTIGAMTNNGVGTAGINWAVSLMPVRIRSVGGTNTDLINANAAAGIDYAVASGAPISNNSWHAAGGGYVFSQDIYDAIRRAQLAGHLFIGGAGNDRTNNDVSPFYPASYDLDNMISATIVNGSGQLLGNYGANTVDLAVSSDGGSSTASSHTTGVAALLKTLHPEWTYGQIKNRILSTVDSLPSLTGKTVTGGTLNAATALAATSILVSDPSVIEGNSGTTQMIFTVTRVGDDTGSVTLNWSTANGTAAGGSDYVAAAGQVTFLPSGTNTQTIAISINGDLAIEPLETFFLNLSVASGNVVLADEQAQGTILDDDTKFYVVNEGTPDRTYEYGLSGNAVENYSLNGANTAPRGAASTAAGTKVWVLDANKTVYVYNTSGGLLGSWTAGGMAGNAQVEGLATNGTDIWLLDNGGDKVYKYAGAASRLSGSQSAASSFTLSNGKNGNANGKGIVTDGTSLWVVDDGAFSDKVFKYTLAGSSLGNWTIDAANAHPTGLTINPASVSDIWIVDNVTLKVYQYVAAASRTSGSQSAAATFALATGNTNPQDIADPPAPDMAISASDDSPVSIHPAVVRSLPISRAASSVQTPSLNLEFLGWLAQTQPAFPTLGGALAQAVTQAPVISLAQVTPVAVPSTKATPETSLRPTGTSIPHHQVVDLVFSDPSLGSMELEFLSRA